MKFLPNKNSFKLVSTKRKPSNEILMKHETSHTEEISEIKDFDKRNFLKILGIASVGLIASSAFPRKADALIIGNQSTTGSLGLKDHLGNPIDPAKENGNLATIAGKDFAKESGGNLASINTNTGTIIANTSPLANLQFDTSNNLKVVTTGGGGGGGGAVQVEDSTQAIINPSTDESVVYLRRMVKLMEAMATVDSANRQKLTLDAITGGLTLSTVTTVGTVSTITGGTISTITNPVPVGNIATISGMDREQYINIAKGTWAEGIRQNLVWN